MTDHLEILRQYQAWRTGNDPRPLAGQGFTPGQLTQAVDACIREIEQARKERAR